MDKVLAFSILSASSADFAAGAGTNATSGSWARLSWRGKKHDNQTAEAERQHQQLGEGNSQSQAQLPRREETRRPRFALEFDGIDCFETIVWR